ncbi:MAG: chromate transporter [Oligoflexia bacterium]|nr:chromate transporter [Oligoflexia bacterium]
MDPASPTLLHSLADLAVSWGRVGLVAFGGGGAMVPFMKAECVDLRSWMTDEQFLEALALSSALPGPISAKMSVYVGLQIAGGLGAAVAFSAVMTPPALMMLGLSAVYARFRDKPAVLGAMSAVKPVVVALLFWAALALAPDGVRSLRAAIIAVAAGIALFAKVPPALVIVVAMAGGAMFLR